MGSSEKKPGKQEPMPLRVEMEADESEAKAHARTILRPSVQSALTVRDFSGDLKSLDINAVVEEISGHVHAAKNGDLSRQECILAAQVQTLDQLFNMMSRMAAKNMNAGYLHATESYMRMAMKAQFQCRATVETLAEIKNPSSPTFVRQQNVGQNVQVNNGVGQQRASRAPEKTINPTNELLEHQHAQRLDIGATSAASGANQELEAVGAVNRSQDAGRKAA